MTQETYKDVMSFLKGDMDNKEMGELLLKLEDRKLAEGLFTFLMMNEKIRYSINDLFFISTKAGFPEDYLDEVNASVLEERYDYMNSQIKTENITVSG